MSSFKEKSDRELLEELYLLVQENRKDIKKLRSRIRWQNIVGILKWVIYIGIAIGLYAYLQPFIISIGETFSSLKEGAASIEDLKDKFPTFPF